MERAGHGHFPEGPALRALGMIGVLDQCVEKGFGYSYFKACNAHGQVTGTVELPRLNGPDYPATIGIMRQAVHSVLKDAVAMADVPVRLGVTVASLEQDDDRVAVQFTDGTRSSYDLVVGADGTNSKIRDLVFGTECTPKYTGQAVWRATVSRPPRCKRDTRSSGRATRLASIRCPTRNVRFPRSEFAGLHPGFRRSTARGHARAAD